MKVALLALASSDPLAARGVSTHMNDPRGKLLIENSPASRYHLV